MRKWEVGRAKGQGPKGLSSRWGRGRREEEVGSGKGKRSRAEGPVLSLGGEKGKGGKIKNLKWEEKRLLKNEVDDIL